MDRNQVSLKGGVFGNRHRNRSKRCWYAGKWRCLSNGIRERIGRTSGSTVFDDSLAKIFTDSDHSEVETREIVVGHSLTGRLLLVSFTERVLDRVRTIGAREATRIETKDYEEAG